MNTITNRWFRDHTRSEQEPKSTSVLVIGNRKSKSQLVSQHKVHHYNAHSLNTKMPAGYLT